MVAREEANSSLVQRIQDAVTHSLEGGQENDLGCPVGPRIEASVCDQPGVQAVPPEGEVSLGLEGFGNNQTPHHTVTIQGCFHRCSTLSPCYTHQKTDFLPLLPSPSG